MREVKKRVNEIFEDTGIPTKNESNEDDKEENVTKEERKWKMWKMDPTNTLERVVKEKS